MDAVTDKSTRPVRSRGRRLKARGWIFASGAFAGLAIVVTALIVLGPLTAARTDLRQIADNGAPVQAQSVSLRTTLADWQFFVERELDALAPGVVPAPAAVVRGGQLLATQTAQATALSRDLRRVGFTSDARHLDNAITAFGRAVPTLAPGAAGQPVDPATLSGLVAEERTATEGVWSV